MVEKIDYIWFVVAMSSLVAIFLVFIIIDLVILYRNKKKRLEEKLLLEHQKFTQKIEQQENKNLQAILDALEADRERIAQDLHDRIGAGISTAKLYFESLKDMIGDENKKVTDNFTKVENLLTRSIDEVRQVSRNITSSVLADFGLVPALIDLKETIEESGRLTFALNHTLHQRADKNIEINAYRVIQELVSNTIKYAESTVIELNIHELDEVIHIHYRDNGKGFDTHNSNTGQGLKNINTRINALGGTVSYTSRAADGTSFQFKIPKNTPIG